VLVDGFQRTELASPPRLIPSQKDKKADQTMLRLDDVPLQGMEALCRRNRIHRLSLFAMAVHEDFRPESDRAVFVEFQGGARQGSCPKPGFFPVLV